MAPLYVSGEEFKAALSLTGLPFEDDLSDEMYDKAVQLVTESRQASISWVQRRLRVGYNRAARLLEQMEKSGLVSALSPSGNRDLLVPRREE